MLKYTHFLLDVFQITNFQIRLLSQHIAQLKVQIDSQRENNETYIRMYESLKTERDHLRQEVKKLQVS